MPSNWRTTRANAIAARCRQHRHLMNSPAMQDSHVVSGIASIQHGNVRLSRRSERSLQPVLVTVDTHRIHALGVFNQANSNDGAVFLMAQCFSLWDLLFGTYPSISHAYDGIGPRSAALRMSRPG